MDDSALGEVIQMQQTAQGVSVLRATDGHVFVFTLATLEQLLASAQRNEKGQVVLFVKHGAAA